MQKYMFIKRNGKAMHQLGNVSRNFYPAELIIIHDETKTHWIGRYVDGIEFIDIQFDKNDCRDASKMEIKVWLYFYAKGEYQSISRSK